MTDAHANGYDTSRSAAGDRSPWLIAVVVSIATFMQVLDTSIANVALRHIAGSLAAGVDESTWVITTYLVASAVIVPVSAWLMNVVGRKRFYMICVTLFTVSSVLCGLASSLALLIFFRVFQGLGGGGMVPSEQAILADTFPPAQRAQAFALYGIAVIVAPTIGPALGGWITDNWSWHWIFFINLPVGIVSLVLVHWLLVEPDALERERRERLAGGLHVDWGGIILVGIWLGCLEIVLDKGQREDWFQSNFINTFAALSTIAFLLFVPWELTRREPIVDLSLMGRRQFVVCFVMMMMVGATMFSSTQLLPQLLQESFNYTATLSGLALVLGGITMLLMMPITAQATKFIQPRYLMALGLLIMAASMWHFTSLPPDASFSFFSWARAYQMIGMPFLFVPITIASYSGLPPEQTNQASALINVARNLGGSIGVSMATTMLAQRAQFHQARLVDHLAPSSLQYQEALRQAAAHFAAMGASQADAQRQALGWMAQQVEMQSSLLSYIDVFWMFAVAGALLIRWRCCCSARHRRGRMRPRIDAKLFRGRHLGCRAFVVWKLRGRRGHHRGAGGEDIVPVSVAGRIDTHAIDHLLGLLGARAVRQQLAIPADGVDRAPGAEVEDRRVPVDPQRQHRRAEKVGHHIVAGEAAHRPAMLAGHHRGMRAVDQAPGTVARSEHAGHAFHPHERVDRKAAEPIAFHRDERSQRVRPHAGAPDDGRRGNGFARLERRTAGVDRGDAHVDAALDPERGKRLVDHGLRMRAHIRADAGIGIGKNDARVRGVEHATQFPG